MHCQPGLHAPPFGRRLLAARIKNVAIQGRGDGLHARVRCRNNGRDAATPGVRAQICVLVCSAARHPTASPPSIIICIARMFGDAPSTPPRQQAS